MRLLILFLAAGARAQSSAAKKAVAGRVSQVIGAVVDVEFDSVDDVPDILNALTIKVNVEKYNKKNDLIRNASLLPKQIREAKARKASLVAAEKEWLSSGASKKVATEAIKALRDAAALDEEALSKLEKNYASQEQGLGVAIKQVRSTRATCGWQRAARLRRCLAIERHPSPLALQMRPSRS